ncbi:hypothetical protein ACFQ7J_01865 [Streptomyces sp. NPDC056501]|uniref:hypothetical protein n=1 Tax=Streptomyces sp. NPDC056501 TaxID=3345841 RepID=UPI0036A69FE0
MTGIQAPPHEPLSTDDLSRVYTALKSERAFTALAADEAVWNAVNTVLDEADQAQLPQLAAQLETALADLYGLATTLRTMLACRADEASVDGALRQAAILLNDPPVLSIGYVRGLARAVQGLLEFDAEQELLELATTQ